MTTGAATNVMEWNPPARLLGPRLPAKLLRLQSAKLLRLSAKQTASLRPHRATEAKFRQLCPATVAGP